MEKRKLFMALLLAVGSLTVSAQTLVFHLSGGAKSTVSLPATFTVTPTGDKLVIDGGESVVELAKDDVMCVTYHGKKGDVNEDETVDVADIATIVNILVGKSGEDSPITHGEPPAGVEAVDLGLPSGKKWANMNVGAKKPEDYGLFFAWGETKGYTSDTSDGHSFDWANYKWCNGSSNTMTKYCTDSSYGTVDGKATLDLEDDAAYVNWGSSWRMPTIADMEELLDNTTSEWTTLNGIYGRRFTNKTNGNSIFLPAAGDRYSSDLGSQGTGGNYWSSSLSGSYSYDARGLYFYSDYARASSNSRCCGFTVRPVLRN